MNPMPRSRFSLRESSGGRPRDAHNIAHIYVEKDSLAGGEEAHGQVRSSLLPFRCDLCPGVGSLCENPVEDGLATTIT